MVGGEKVIEGAEVEELRGQDVGIMVYVTMEGNTDYDWNGTTDSDWNVVIQEYLNICFK